VALDAVESVQLMLGRFGLDTPSDRVMALVDTAVGFLNVFLRHVQPFIVRLTYMLNELGLSTRVGMVVFHSCW
jgi:hypothetical protein